MFGKNSSKNLTKKDFVIVRSYNGRADHIARNDGSLPLCGYVNGLFTNHFVNKIDVIDAIPNQNDSWFYCPECAEKTTGFDAETIESYRH